MESRHYQLAPGIRVRQESFGLLFYNSQSTKLTFIESGSLISAQLLDKGGADEEYLGRDPESNQKIQGLLARLAERGLLHVREESA